MFTDPIEITHGASTKSLNRTGAGLDTAGYATSDRAVRVAISHSYGKRERRMVKQTTNTLVTNPLIEGQNVSQSFSCHLVTDGPAGYATAAAKEQVVGFLNMLLADSGENIEKLLGGES